MEREKVKSVYKSAIVVSPWPGHFTIQKFPYHTPKSVIGTGNSELEAWLDAATRLGEG